MRKESTNGVWINPNIAAYPTSQVSGEACKNSRTDIDTRVSANIRSVENLGRLTIPLIVASSFLGANLGERVLRALSLRELSFGGGGIEAEGVAAVAAIESVPPVAEVPGEVAVAIVAVVPEEVAAG